MLTPAFRRWICRIPNYGKQRGNHELQICRGNCPARSREVAGSETQAHWRRGVTLTKVKGFGEYKNFFTSDLLSDHTQVEIFTEESKVEPLLDALLEIGRSDIPGSGVVAVIPVDRFLHLRTGTEVLPVPST
ncbi:P-II family nitrogen regulator [Polaromonas sp. P2-4]|nr:P-II family nitrogen regulator [Polaromonas sp. P2-4]